MEGRGRVGIETEGTAKEKRKRGKRREGRDRKSWKGV